MVPPAADDHPVPDGGRRVVGQDQVREGHRSEAGRQRRRVGEHREHLHLAGLRAAEHGQVGTFAQVTDD